MANAFYPLWKQELLKGTANTGLSATTVKAVLVDTGTYTYNAAHQFRSSLTGVAGGVHPTLGSKTFVNGIFDAADTTFTAVTAGATVEAAVIYIDTGSAATDVLVAFIDTFTSGMPATPNGGDIVAAWNASGIFQL